MLAETQYGVVLAVAVLDKIRLALLVEHPYMVVTAALVLLMPERRLPARNRVVAVVVRNRTEHLVQVVMGR